MRDLMCRGKPQCGQHEQSLRLIKVAARVIETASRVRIALASACPDATLFRHVAVSLRAASP